eukprot:scaffold74614_cov63-Phaeocystis_antarctica.AAC.1
MCTEGDSTGFAGFRLNTVFVFSLARLLLNYHRGLLNSALAKLTACTVTSALLPPVPPTSPRITVIMTVSQQTAPRGALRSPRVHAANLSSQTRRERVVQPG